MYSSHDCRGWHAIDLPHISAATYKLVANEPAITFTPGAPVKLPDGRTMETHFIQRYSAADEETRDKKLPRMAGRYAPDVNPNRGDG